MAAISKVPNNSKITLAEWTFNLLDGILKKYYHILKEHRKLSKIAKFGCKMLYTIENIALRIWQILYTFVLRVKNNTQLILLGYSFLTDNTKL